MDGILKDTPAYLLEIMAKLTRALLYSMDIPEEQTEEAVAKIKERRMGRLFEGITFSYQDEINKMRAAREKAWEEAREEIEAAREEAQKEIEAARRESRMISHIYKMLLHHYSAEEIKNSLIQEFGLSEQEAGEEYQKAIE